MTYKKNYIESIRKELVDIVQRELTPLAHKYRYSQSPLEENIKWRPMVLVLGNYSSGKSTLINELLGMEVQRTGQAPTDDSFTVIAKSDRDGPTVGEIEEKDGKVLLNDDQYPFSALRRHGQRFSSHFRLKKVQSSFLDNLVLIDTPGMVDSIAERDRGYNYQEVVGDLAGIADLILILFDPHKAGTIKETYESLRSTLPRSTYEDRVVFVLNRVDECTNLNDLLRVYGTLCWNLSQMTGRKDIPLIHLTWSPEVMGPQANADNQDFLNLLENQRNSLKRDISNAPRHRLDHLATYVEEHGRRLEHLLEALASYAVLRRRFRMKMWSFGVIISLIAGLASFGILTQLGVLGAASYEILAGSGLAVAVVIYFVWAAFVRYFLADGHHRTTLLDLDRLTPLDNQERRDTWDQVKDLAYAYLDRQKGEVNLRRIKRDLKKVKEVAQSASRDARKALGELETLQEDDIRGLQVDH